MTIFLACKFNNAPVGAFYRLVGSFAQVTYLYIEKKKKRPRKADGKMR